MLVAVLSVPTNVTCPVVGCGRHPYVNESLYAGRSTEAAAEGSPHRWSRTEGEIPRCSRAPWAVNNKWLSHYAAWHFMLAVARSHVARLIDTVHPDTYTSSNGFDHSKPYDEGDGGRGFDAIRTSR